MQVKTAVRYHLTPARIAVIKNDTKKTNVGRDVKKRELLYPVIENINWYRHCVQWCGSTSKNGKYSYHVAQQVTVTVSKNTN